MNFYTTHKKDRRFAALFSKVRFATLFSKVRFGSTFS
jgi:hypothetical protein